VCGASSRAVALTAPPCHLPPTTTTQLSNDGKLLAYIKPDPSNSVNNLYVRRLPSDEQMAGMKHDVALMEQPGAGGTDLQVTFDTKRGVHTYAW
jgi:hypothetical protein